MSGRAQLFVGRLPIDIRERDVEKVFEKYGRLVRCDVKYGMFGASGGRGSERYGSSGRRGSGRTGMAYAFLDYDDRRDAEDAIKYENGREIRGQSIVVEWARGPSYRSGRENYGRSSRQGGGSDECYRCRRTGHWARNCPEQDRGERFDNRSSRRHSRSRSRSRSRSYRRRRSVSRSRSKSRDRQRSSPDYRQKSRSVSRERKRKVRSPSGSVSPSKSLSRSRSRSRGKSPKKDKSKKSKARESSKSASRSPSVSKSRSRRSPRKASLSPVPEKDYADKRDDDDHDRRSTSRRPRRSISRSPSKENNRSDDNESDHSISRSKSR